jgi:hypothetical protein
VQFLFDLHAMPCGASDGTYNGVYPEDPIFFQNSTATTKGLTVVENMLSWYTKLPADLQTTVHGFTLLNEPGLGKVGNTRSGVTPLPRGNTSVIGFLTHGTRFSTKTYTLEDAIGSHACSLEASRRVTNGIPLGLL